MAGGPDAAGLRDDAALPSARAAASRSGSARHPGARARHAGVRVLRDPGAEERHVRPAIGCEPAPATPASAAEGVFDRNGEIIADNVPGYALSVLPGPEDSVRATLERLAPLLDLTPSRIDALMARRRRAPGQPLLVSSDLTFEQVSAIQERRLFLPGVYVDERPKRRYPDGPAVAHLVGYIGEISEDELARPEFEGYSAGQLIGKAGIDGATSASGRTPGAVRGDGCLRAHRREYAPGEWCSRFPERTSSTRLDLQRWVAPRLDARGDRRRGTGTGHVLAMYSNPSFDPNLFVGGIDPEAAADPGPGQAVAQSRHRRYVSASFAFKLVTAAIAMERPDPDQPLPIPCRGGIR